MHSKYLCGASLISILIGLLVSSLCLLGIMTMHKSLVGVAIQSKSDAVHDGLITSAMVQIQMSLQDAGFGMETATSDDVVVSTSSSASSLLWRFQEGGITVCRGVSDKPYTDADSGTTGRHLVAVENTTSGCTAVADLSTLLWTETETLGRFRNQSSRLFTFNVAQANCSPFGFGSAAPHLLVAISAPGSAELAGAAAAGADINTITYQYCLSNTHL